MSLPPDPSGELRRCGMTAETSIVVTVQAGDEASADRLAGALAAHVHAQFGAHTHRLDEETRESRYEMHFGCDDAYERGVADGRNETDAWNSAVSRCENGGGCFLS